MTLTLEFYEEEFITTLMQNGARMDGIQDLMVDKNADPNKSAGKNVTLRNLFWNFLTQAMKISYLSMFTNQYKERLKY